MVDKSSSAPIMARVLESKVNYGFVVLNYNNYQDTIACVNSILRITHRDDYCIVIVDNASPNDSCEVLKREFEAHPKITLVLTENNRGYSGGNNAGIRKLVERGVSQVIIATNDTEVFSMNLLEEFDKVNSNDVGIVGTDVVTPEGVHQNPPLYKPTLLYFINLYLYEPMAWLRARLYRLFPAVEQQRRSATARGIERLREVSGVKEPCSVYMLHGCFLYLTKNYLDKVGLLDEQLFMYGEEDLMSWNCERFGLKRLYLPNVRILHKDAQSTKGVHKAGRDEFVRAMTVRSKQYLARKIGMWYLLMAVLRYLPK